VALELKQQLRLSQQLVMTPQLQQAIKLLQLSRLELVGLVQRELEENPVLEDAADLDAGTGDAPDAPEAQDAPEASEGGDAPELEAAPDGNAPEPPAPGDEPEPTDADKVADIDWKNYAEAYPQTGMREARDDDERPTFEATLTRRATLAEHLEWQLHLSPFSEEEKAAAEIIIGNIDERGYLRIGIEEVAREAAVERAAAEAALAKLQDFDPAGVAARDLRECLTIQVRLLGIEDPLVDRILAECLDLLVKRDFRGVSRKLGVSIEEAPGGRRHGTRGGRTAVALHEVPQVRRRPRSRGHARHRGGPMP
jgi:RNA polymerase sigma-54 factor